MTRIEFLEFAGFNVQSRDEAIAEAERKAAENGGSSFTYRTKTVSGVKDGKPYFESIGYLCVKRSIYVGSPGRLFRIPFSVVEPL